MVFRVFIFTFLFKTNGKKVHMDENDVRHCYCMVIFRKYHPETYLIAAMFEVPSQQL